MRGRLEADIDEDEDSCRIYRLCQACAAEVCILGKGDHYAEPGFVVV